MKNDPAASRGAKPWVIPPFGLLALGELDRPAGASGKRELFARTVPHAVKQQRRERNRVARASRRINRGK